jgi:6-pyruvoyltetrahydropterin/6-carboxytetrahydropterin synthase
MYEVTIIKTFSAAHFLADIGGKCEELHGHNFKVEVTVAAPQLKSTGLLIDFREIKEWLKSIIESMDHQHLNELTQFAGINPSSENIAHYICRELEPQARSAQLQIARIKVWESENAVVTYIPDQTEG